MSRLHLILAVMITYSTSSVVKSAPSQLGDPTEVAPGSELGIHEVTTSANIRVPSTNGNSSSSSSSISNSTKLPSSSSSSISNSTKLPSSSSSIDTQDVITSEKDTSRNKVSYPPSTDIKKTGARSNVMALSDDVITDALFTNIDTLQDHLEVCEEGLRQQLRLLSHGKLLQEVVAEEKDYTPRKAALVIKRNKNDDKYDDGEDEDEADNADDADNVSEKYYADEIKDEMMMYNKDGAISTDANSLPGQKTTDEHVLRRRSVTGSLNAEQAPEKAENLAQSVVNRLSGRLEYLKASLIQCHLLYRQFGQL